MKSKQFLSVLCAVSMLLSALPFASAAEAVSEYAGQTISVQVVEETETGLASRVIQVAIPEGATDTEKNAVINAAAFGQSFSARSSQTYRLSSMSNIDLTPEEQKVGGGSKMPSGSYTKFEQIIINISVKSASSSAAKLCFEVRDATYPDMSTAWQNVSINTNEIVFGTRGLPSVKGGAVNVYAKTSEGSFATLNSCTVFAVAY